MKKLVKILDLMRFEILACDSQIVNVLKIQNLNRSKFCNRYSMWIFEVKSNFAEVEFTFKGSCRDGEGTGRDSPAIFCPGPACSAGKPCGTVPRKFFSIPLVPRDQEDHGNLRDGTGIPKLSRDNRPSLGS